MIPNYDAFQRIFCSDKSCDISSWFPDGQECITCHPSASHTDVQSTLSGKIIVCTKIILLHSTPKLHSPEWCCLVSNVSLRGNTLYRPTTSPDFFLASNIECEWVYVGVNWKPGATHSHGKRYGLGLYKTQRGVTKCFYVMTWEWKQSALCSWGNLPQD